MNLEGVYRYSNRNQVIEIELGRLVTAASHKTDATPTKPRVTMASIVPCRKAAATTKLDKETSGCDIRNLYHGRDCIIPQSSYLSDLEYAEKTTTRREIETAVSSIPESHVCARNTLENEKQADATRSLDLKPEEGVNDDDGKTSAGGNARITQKPQSPPAKEIIQVPLLDWKDCDGPWKTILLIGDTMTGKSTTINFMVNYLMGVRYEDPFRYEVAAGAMMTGRNDSVTQEVTAYNFYPVHPDITYGVTIIDTPGFCDSVGTEINKTTWEKIKGFVKEELTEIDAVCFTVRADCPRKTIGAQYAYNKISSLLGEDVIENVFTFVTSCDGETPAATDAVGPGSIKERCICLSSSAHLRTADQLLQCDQEGLLEDGPKLEKNAVSWDKDCHALQRFFIEGLLGVPIKLLCSGLVDTSERESLENVVVAINKQIRIGLDTLECIRLSVRCIRQRQKELDANAGLKIRIPKASFHKVDIRSEGMFVRTCLVCNFTCRVPSGVDDSDSKSSSSDRSPPCPICPRKRRWNESKNLSYWIEHTTEWADEALLQTEEAAEAVSKNISFTEAVLRRQRASYVAAKMQIHNDIDIVRRSIVRLRSIARRSGTLDPDQHFRQMIDAELARHEPGVRARVRGLRAIREEARSSRGAQEENCKGAFQCTDLMLVEIDRAIEEVAHEGGNAVRRSTSVGVVARLFDRALNVRVPVTSPATST